MAKFELTDGSLRILMRGGKLEDPIVQVLGSKKIASNSEKERYRMLISDGRYCISYAMLHTFGQEIAQYSIVKLKRYVTSVINNTSKNDKRVLIIMELDVLQEGAEVLDKIGDPQQLSNEEIMSSGESNEATSAADPASSSASNADVPPAKRPATMAAVQAVKNVAPNDSLDMSMRDAICPISHLSPYQNKWCLKVLVTSKTQMKQWSNSRGSGCLFSMDLMDDSGEIRCTAFREMAEKYHSFVQVDKMYYISKCQIKVANKQFSAINNDYEMTIGNESIIQECHDNDASLSSASMYNFVPLDLVKDKTVGSLIDIIGVCKGASDLQEFTAKTTGREMKKREIYLLDQSNHEICLALWGKDAEDFTSAEDNPIIAIRGAKLGEYLGGKTLSTSGSTLRINPEIPVAFKLKGWYDTRDINAAVTNLSTRTGSGGASFDTPWMTFREVAETQNMGTDPKGDYFQLFGTVSLINCDRMTYMACPKEGCNKKITDLNNGMYKCEKCDEEFPRFKYRLVPSVNIADATGDQWVSMFNEVAEKLFNSTAEVIGNAMDQAKNHSNDQDIADITQNITFTEGLYKFRAKQEMFNDEMRLKTVLVHFEPIKPEHNNRLIIEIEKLTGLEIN